MASRPIYQFYAELKEYEPKIWRRFQVMDNVTVARLGYILMTLYEMRAGHLFQFTYAPSVELPQGNVVKMAREWRFGIQNDEFFTGDQVEQFPATEYKLSAVFCRTGERLLFEYDFGDGWMVDVVLEAILEDKALPGRELPRVLEGEGYGIIEDCGGVWGLESIAEAFRSKKGEDYEQYRDWLEVDELDMAAFDLDDMNMRLKKVPRILTQIYEEGLEPSERSYELLMRYT